MQLGLDEPVALSLVASLAPSHNYVSVIRRDTVEKLLQIIIPAFEGYEQHRASQGIMYVKCSSLLFGP